MLTLPKSYLDEFDPNEQPEPYATFTHGRTPYFKLHSQLVHAVNAMVANRTSGIILYGREDGRWVQLARFEQHYTFANPDDSLLPQRCDGCSQSTIRTSQHYYHQGQPYNAAWQFLARANGNGTKLVKPLKVLTLCPECRQALGY